MIEHRTTRRRRSGVLTAVLIGVFMIIGLLAGCAGPTVADPADVTADPFSGLPVINEDQLPPEAGDTIALIDAGGPFPYEEDGDTFYNREGILPDASEGLYREYTVETPGEDDRGARRIVTGDEDTIFYYTDDHYQSFSLVQR